MKGVHINSTDILNASIYSSSVGLEHLPYKQGVTGSNPVVPTKHESCDTQVSWDFLLLAYINK